ncbi:MAG: trypsin-like serine protease [Myxococcales bacterium]|nr:trypsin-like serine protease [Myxococcales bacterium]
MHRVHDGNVGGSRWRYLHRRKSGLITCSGDSGGPAFIEQEGVVYVEGVHSFGLEGCTSPRNGDTRVELFAEDFVLPWIQTNDPLCGTDLIGARIGCSDDPDCEPWGPDGTCTEGGALPDVDCQDRNLRDLCRADQQCTTNNCVVWRAEPRMSFCTEDCSTGIDSCPAGMSSQDVQPFGRICYYDDEPSGALGSACDVNYECGSSLCEGVSVCTRATWLRDSTAPKASSAAMKAEATSATLCQERAEGVQQVETVPVSSVFPTSC